MYTKLLDIDTDIDTDINMDTDTDTDMEFGVFTFIIPDSPISLTLTVNGTLQVSNGGTITTLGNLINNSNQTIQVDEFALFTIDGGTCFNIGTFTNNGKLDISGGGSLQVAEGSTIENNGDVYVYGTNSNIQITGDATFTNSGGYSLNFNHLSDGSKTLFNLSKPIFETLEKAQEAVNYLVKKI